MKILFSFVLFLFVTGLVACASSPKYATQIPAAIETPSANTIRIPKDLVKPSIKPPNRVFPNHTTALETTQFSAAPDRDLFRLTKELIPSTGEIPRIVTSDTTEYQEGRTDTFWLVDLVELKTYQSEFELVLVTPHAYWYVENILDISLSDIERSATVFEDVIYPVVTSIFGSEWTPGIDNDAHLNILNASLRGVAGYYNSVDEYPTSVNSKSNQREMIYVNALDVHPGSNTYDQVLAHELQHAIHWYADTSEDTWINEGLSELSSSIALDSYLSISPFLKGSPVSLINWPTSSSGGIANYGASSLFMHYFSEHYTGQDGLKAFVAQQEDGIAGVNAYLMESGYKAQFEDVFRQWSVANILDGDGILGYEKLTVNANVSQRIKGFNRLESAIPQYSTEYTELHDTTEPFTLTFEGHTTTPLLPIDIGGSGCWWGNSGDSIDSTLTYKVQLASGATPKLIYDLWFEIEENWDYLYLEVSDDHGQTWRIIGTQATSNNNPIGNSFGPGYTGNSGGWIQENIDLSAYAGEDILMRFQYVTDDAVNAVGPCIRNLSIDGEDIGTDDRNWKANGFVFTDNVVDQRFQVQVVTIGNEPKVQQIDLNGSNSAMISLNPPQKDQRLIVAVGALAEKTRENASYTLTVDQSK